MKKVPYASVVGSLMYAMVCTRLDIAHAVGVVSKFFSNPGKEHWHAINGFSDISEVLLKFVYVLVMANLYFVDI